MLCLACPMPQPGGNFKESGHTNALKCCSNGVPVVCPMDVATKARRPDGGSPAFGGTLAHTPHWRQCPCLRLVTTGGRVGSVNQPSETQECIALASWLDRRSVIYTHVPMGGVRTQQGGTILRRMGTKAGVPDYLIFTPPPLMPDVRGVAIEMKRRKGGVVSPKQEKWLAYLSAIGWHALVARGFSEALMELKRLGYGAARNDR